MEETAALLRGKVADGHADEGVELLMKRRSS